MKKLYTIIALFLLVAVPAQAKDHENKNAGTAASAHPEATKAGFEMLQAGGSATDAAMAMMLALTVVEPQSSGIGGGGFFLHHDAKSGWMQTIDGREMAPAAAGSDRFLDENGKPMGFRSAAPGGISVGVPGNMRLMEMAHKKWGKLEWAKLFEPAIKLAEDGYAVSIPQYDWMKRLGPLWNDFPEIQKLYWRGGQPVPVGTMIKNPELAALLRDLQSGGAEAFYTGKTAAAISAAVANAPSNKAEITPDDLTNYNAILREPVCTSYRVYKVCGMGPPSSGATTVLQILGMIERFDMGELYKNEPMKAWHVIAEAMRLAYADREKYLGDQDFVAVPVAGLIDKSYLAKRSQLIALQRARPQFPGMETYPAGSPPGAQVRTAALSSEVAGTTHFTAVDSEGNIANMTSTVEGPFGSQLLARGMVLNNELTDFTFAPEKDGAPVANRVQPGKRPLSSMSPTIVYDDSGKPVLAVGSAGGKRIIMHVTKTLIGVLDYNLPLEEAMALPNIYFGGDGVLVENGTDLAKNQTELSKFGHLVVSTNLPSKLAGAQKTEKGWVGAVDPRSTGQAVSELP
ncbi:gamma-glutamyltransferase [Parasphingorhabdus halotolerans]|uniref:Glutathione hydrolase proenzyme n=1 Tax=Parasphingorhabdus halotolerans TaxID=2725558 RepID=A0A6H2DJN8_9SPHN|nr:gamma-glutamyltransferase [Parasphingorhabdus halotolerans]QJB68892.1 gamma-glutamyltransferase [Parasphingorhabdus halotolerans]